MRDQIGLWLRGGLCALGVAVMAAPATAEIVPQSVTGEKEDVDTSKINEQFVELYKQAAALLREKKYKEALAKLDEAQKIETNVNAINLRGAIYTEMRDYDQAQKYFEEASKAQPNAFGPRFNLGEVEFLRKNYAGARAIFQQLQQKNPNNELVNYKIFLTYLLEKKMTEARKMLGEFNFAGELPAYYFANAAWEFANNKPKVAYGWIGSAQNIYPAQANNLFADSLVEVGWVDPEKAKVDSELAPPEVIPPSEGGLMSDDGPSLLPGGGTPQASPFQELDPN